MVDRPQHCGSHRSPGDVSLSSLHADHIDYAFLSAARYFFLSFANNDHSAWIATILGAEDFFPFGDSLNAVRGALALVHEMRCSRRSNFCFSNPRCPCCAAIVTQDERYLLQMIQAARRGSGSQVASNAMLLCEGNDTSRVIAAAYTFAETCSKAPCLATSV